MPQCRPALPIADVSRPRLPDRCTSARLQRLGQLVAGRHAQANGGCAWKTWIHRAKWKGPPRSSWRPCIRSAWMPTCRWITEPAGCPLPGGRRPVAGRGQGLPVPLQPLGTRAPATASTPSTQQQRPARRYGCGGGRHAGFLSMACRQHQPGPQPRGRRFRAEAADGLWAYQLAVVVDDAAQGMTDIVVARDLLDSTPRQILLQQALSADAALPAPSGDHRRAGRETFQVLGRHRRRRQPSPASPASGMASPGAGRDTGTMRH